MLSQTAEYALRAVLYLARLGPRKLVPAETISTALGAPANYLSKTLHQLARARIVEGVRGPAGGFRLLVPPEQLTVVRVVETFDEPQLRPMCLLGARPCNARRPCDVHQRWSAMTAAMRAPLAETTVAELLADAAEAAPPARRSASGRGR